MCDILLEKIKVVVTERVFMQKQLSKSFFKKGVVRNFAKFTIKHLCRKNETVAPVFSCDFCEICKITFFAEHYSSISSSEAYRYQFEPRVIKKKQSRRRSRFQSNSLQMFLKIDVLKKLANSTEKHQY